MGVSGKHDSLPMQMAALLRAGGAAEDALRLIKLEDKLIAAVLKKAPQAELKTLARRARPRPLRAEQTAEPRSRRSSSTPWSRPASPPSRPSRFVRCCAAIRGPRCAELKTTPGARAERHPRPAGPRHGEPRRGIEKALRGPQQGQSQSSRCRASTTCLPRAKTGQVEEYSKIEGNPRTRAPARGQQLDLRTHGSEVMPSPNRCSRQ